MPAKCSLRACGQFLLPAHLRARVRLFWFSRVFTRLCHNVLQEICAYLCAPPVLLEAYSRFVVCFDIAEARFALIPTNFPKSVIAMGAVSLGEDCLFFCGGLSNRLSAFPVRKAAYLLSGGSLETLPHMQRRRSGHAVVYDEQSLSVFVFGGVGPRPPLDCEVYDCLAGTWTEVQGMFRRRYYFWASCCARRVYLCGGGEPQCEVFDIPTRRFALLPRCVLTDIRDLFTVAYEDRLLVRSSSHLHVYDFASATVQSKPIVGQKYAFRAFSVWDGKAYALELNKCSCWALPDVSLLSETPCEHALLGSGFY